MTKNDFKDLNWMDAPKIVVEPPGPMSKRLLEKQMNLEGGAVSYPRAIPASFEEARGATVRDVDGNIFLDFFGGAGVLNVGHCNPEVVRVLKHQLERLTHSLDFPTPPRAELVDELMEVAPLGLKDACKVFFGGPTGSDAIEVSWKLAKFNTGRQGIIAFEGSYHGMTSGALSLSSSKNFKKNYLPLVPEVHFIPYAYCYRCAFGLEYPDCNLRCAAYLEHVLEDPHSGVVDPAAIIVEPVQGEGGTIPPPLDFLRELRRITEEYKIPLIMDEIQAGIGRTGKMFSCEHSGATPDIMTISKGIGGGLPLSGILYKSELDIWSPGAHIGTFRGHVLAMAAGVATLQFMREYHVCAHSLKLGEFMLNRLKEMEEEHKYIGESRGLGLMLGIEFVRDKQTKEPWPEMANNVRTECYKRGLLVELGGHYNNLVRFLPPLILPYELAERGLDIVSDAIRTLEK